MKTLIVLLLSAVPCLAASVRLGWNASTTPDVTYVIRFGVAGGVYGNPMPVGSGLSVTVDGLTDGASYQFVVTAKNSAGDESSYSNEVTYNVPPVVVIPTVPPPWKIGAVGVSLKPGSATFSNNTFTVSGAGQIEGRADAFFFVHQPLSADGEITARVVMLEGGFACVMIRETLSANSRYVAIGVDETLKFREQHRSKTGNRTSSTTSSLAAYLPNIWIRVRRTGNSFACYRSTDGSSWVKQATPSVSMSGEVLVGLAVASGSLSSTESADFTQVSVTP